MKILNSSPNKTWSSNPNQPINATPNRNGKKKSEGTRRLHRWWEARYWPLPHHSWPDRCDGVFGAVFDGVKEGRNFQPVYQWSFLVPLIGGRWYISPQLAVYNQKQLLSLALDCLGNFPMDFSNSTFVLMQFHVQEFWFIRAFMGFWWISLEVSFPKIIAQLHSILGNSMSFCLLPLT